MGMMNHDGDNRRGGNDRDRGNSAPGADAQGGARKTYRRKSCRFCIDLDVTINYREPAMLMPFLNDRSKIIPRRISGNCAKHQRDVSGAIKRARQIALLPYTDMMGEV
jgi:small subunit ribosomal protein S18